MIDKLQKILDQAIDSKRIFGTSFCLKQGNFEWAGASGNMNKASSFFIASTTKLFVTTIILQLIEQNKLSLEDKISNFLNPEILSGLHLFNQNKYSEKITIENLLAHTSGIPDYFQDKNKAGKSLEDKLKSGQDCKWTAEEAIERSKSIQAHFIPGTKGKAHYSDTNYQLLGLIIESITGKSFAQNIQDSIGTPLDLQNTYLYVDPRDSKPVSMYYKEKILSIPQAMISFGPDGGIVSTAQELLLFTEAFFTGKLFSINRIKDLQKWNKIFFPFQSGIGIQLFKLPWYFDPFNKIPYLIGHSGLSGTIAFYAPKKNFFISGTVNQIASPDLSFRLMIKLSQVMK